MLSLPLALALGAAAASAAPAAPPDFLRDVRPILSSHCFKCHGPDETARKGGLRLDLREAALQSAKSGEPAILPGDAAKSQLLRRIFTADEDDLMPPPAAKHPLTSAQKETLQRWIEAGAEYKPHWAFVPPKPPVLPAVNHADWPRNGLDFFALARLEKEGLQPSPRADRHTLARRAYLDLTGLPPTPAQADAFVNDPAPNAYEKLIDELLASPHYGERWARRWLDLARYADTNGYEKDRQRSIWPYRDWVINALNADLPFDQFTIEQLAGDLLPAATQDQIIATGFHRNTMINEEGGIDPLEFRFHAMTDRVHVTATSWLGLTMACAQCHTHKYDPIQHGEYYQFMAFLNNADEPVFPIRAPATTARRAEIEKKIAALENVLPDKFPAPGQIEWHVPAAGQFASENKAEGEFLVDGSIRVTGAKPDKDTYTIQFDLSARKITHLQLEAIPDEKNGPGRTDHGNFVLSEIELAAVGADGAPRQARFTQAEADFSQEGLPVEMAIDGKTEGGWAIAAEAAKRPHRRAIFTLAEPLERAGSVTVRLVQQYGGKHTLGRFRLSFGNDLAAGQPLEQRRLAHREKQFTQWLSVELARALPWQPAIPAAAASDSPTLAIEPDGSVFASGDFTKSDTYRLKFSAAPAGLTAIRLEALPDDRLPARGPGRVYYEGPEGDFWLSTVQARSAGQNLAFASATESFANGGANAAQAIDGDLQSGWSIHGGQGRPHNAVFQLAQPLAAAGELELDLTFEKYYAAGLGKFRVWFTTEKNPRASALSNEALEILVRHRASGVTSLVSAEVTHPERALLVREFALFAPELAAARKEIQDLRNSLPKYPTTLVMSERPAGRSRATHRHHRGEFLQPKEAVSPGIPSFLPALPPGAPSNRLAFARWLVSPQNPLTARVVMNRHWEAFWGRGLVRTTEDFGFQGELPSHPELLDWLAVEFMRQGWSQKKMHKLIVMSAAYQQSSRAASSLLERDPQNLLLARGPRFRIDGELVRDLTLVASGLFSDKVGGPSVFPPQPAGVSTEGAYGALQWQESSGSDRYRRGLYTFAKRTTPYAMTATFDGPSGEACLARRERSNTPLQALTLLNDSVFLESARALGAWAARQGQPVEATVEAVFRKCLTRPPSGEERAQLALYFQAQLRRFSAGELSAAEFLGAELKSEPQSSLNEIAAWTALARVLLNLDETITKS